MKKFQVLLYVASIAVAVSIGLSNVGKSKMANLGSVDCNISRITFNMRCSDELTLCGTETFTGYNYAMGDILTMHVTAGAEKCVRLDPVTGKDHCPSTEHYVTIADECTQIKAQ